MAFFGYNPYNYYHAAPPSNYYPHPFYRHRRPQQPTDVFFPAAETVTERPRRKKSASITIPVFGPDDASPEPANVAKIEKKRTLPAEEAAVRIQAAARGFLARLAVRALRAVEKEVEEIGVRVAREAEVLRGDAKARNAVGEHLMKLLFRLDAVRGAREYRKRVARRVLALQDAVDALEQRTLDVGAAAESEVMAAEVTAAEESVAAPEVADSANHSGKAEAEMEVDGDRAAEETDETKNGTEQAPDANVEDELEMVTEESELAAEAEPPRQEPAGEVSNGKAEAAGGLDAKKLMEMVAVLCEQNAQQCAVIGALAERVDALERTVRRVEDAEGRRRLAKKLRKEGKGRSKEKMLLNGLG